jgi:hypothetical protein
MAFTCNQCPSTFTENKTLNRHIRTKHGNLSLKCEKCAFTTTRKDKLKTHIEAKHYLNKFKCPHCAFECARNDSLTRHIKAYHEVPENPLEPTPNFDWVEDIEQEEREIVKYKCDKCNAEFKDRKNLNKHMKSVHAQEYFACEHCAQVFNRKDNLMRHLPVHKKVKKSKPVPKYALFDEPCDSRKSCFGDKIYTKSWKNRGQHDPVKVLVHYKPKVERTIAYHLQKHGPLKFYVTLKITLQKEDKDGTVEEATDYFRSKSRTVLDAYEFEDIYKEGINTIWNLFDEWVKNGSGWAIKNVNSFDLDVCKYKPARGSSYIPTPKSIAGKKAIINPQNKDEECFKWAVLAALHPVNVHPERVSNYEEYSEELDFTGTSFPVKVSDIPKFERQNKLPINIYTIEEDGKLVNPLYISKLIDPETFQREEGAINLLLIEGKEQNHYTWIKDFDALLSYDSNPKRFCPYCMYGFDKRYNAEEKLRQHIPYCSTNGPQRTSFPKDKLVKFKDTEKQMKLPFCIYADFETHNVKISKCTPNPFEANTTDQTHHEVSGFTFHTVSEFHESKTVNYTGPDAGKVFLQRILEEEKRILKLMEVNKEMVFTAEDEATHKMAENCHICGEAFMVEEDGLKIPSLKGEKVRDHCHFTGKYRGPAHNGCNIQYRKVKKIPVFFHNLSGYDGHIIFQNLSKVKCKDPKVIAKSMEKFISFSIGTLHFKDSAQFLLSSLDKLVSNLKVKAEKEKNIKEMFENTWEYFKTKELPEEAFDLLTRKGVFPYRYMDSWGKMAETKLPPKEEYWNDLTRKHISEKEYERAKEIWDTFGLKTLQELHDLYMDTDVVLLADIFENFRNFSLKNYGLDPAHFSTAPALSWSAAMKYTKVVLELPDDPDITLFIDRGLVGGISMISNQYAKANNPGLGEKWDPQELQSYIMLVDCNNQYGWAMSQFLPTGGFEWVNAEDWTAEKIMNLEDEAEVGYIFEVDLEYPKELHDAHDTYPLAPEHLDIQEKMLSNYQKQLAKDLGIKIGGKKLCLTLTDKKKYITHYRSLKQYLELGLKIQKVHRVLKFDQSKWLEPYIKLNTGLRQAAKSKFEEDLFKLMNNSFFGKTCEDVRKYKEVQIVTEERRAQRILNKPTVKQWKIYEENLAAIQLQRENVELNKPRYIGMTILNLSKLVMYDYHYKYIMPRYPQAKLLFTDTDSFCYWIPTDSNIYKDIQGNEWFDFSNYPQDHPNFDVSKKLKPGYFKDEMGGNPIEEFIGLRSKMYSILASNGNTKKTAKGVSRRVKDEVITHQDYKETLFKKKTMKHLQTRILQKEHELFTSEVVKSSLSPFNDKKWVERDGDTFISYSYGHYKVL